MTKAELIQQVAERVNLTQQDTGIVVNTVFAGIIEALRVGDKKVELRGFGSFRVKQRNAKEARNPKTGDKVRIPAKKIIFFRPSKKLKELVDS
ncbi:MAG: integration host factor subunit beta [Nitrospinae bacterium RIFCSPLOWO2_12_FULL_45_22]|nr:MAG: integration host factor subunit beta [Nitrospinae bacterium RIFCSPLOWO2_12_FULL_45_22]